MQPFDKDITSLFSMELFRQIYFNKNITMLTFNTFITLLVQNGIPFDTSFDPGNRRNDQQLELTIFISPSCKVVIDIDLGNENNKLIDNSYK